MTSEPNKDYDAIVVGSGPNGLAAAICLARSDLRVKVLEADQEIGGGTRTRELTLPGFHHDVCSAVHPMGVASPFFRSLPLGEHGLEWIYPEFPVAHPIDDEPAVLLHHSLDRTASGLGADRQAYLNLLEPLVSHFDTLIPQLLAPFNPFPPNPVLMARFGFKALQSARRLAGSTFETERARALFAGLAGHSILPMEKLTSSAIGLVLGSVAHVIGWPVPRGGSRQIAAALASYFRSIGGQIETGYRVESLEQLSGARCILFDLTPRQILDIAAATLPDRYAAKLERYRYGMGVFKLDLALEGPVPWRDERCARAGTVHIGGTFEEIAASERAGFGGEHTRRPYVILAQQSLFDPTRAPEGRHTVWAYCHVPSGSTEDMTGAIENQIERFAPGFRDRIIGRHAMNTRDMHAYNANYIGGDINGGMQDLTQLFTRPAGLRDPYHIPDTSLYICSSSTPPGGGVHGMCGFHAAQSALKREFGK